MPKKKPGKGLTENQAEYQKQLNRIRRFIRNAEKRGYSFDIDLPTKRPQTVRKRDIERLKRITPETLYKTATYTTETGETLTGTEGRKRENKARSYRAARTKALNKSIANIPKITAPTAPAARQEYYDSIDYAEPGEEAPPADGFRILQNIQDKINSFEPSHTVTNWAAEQQEQNNSLLANALNNAIQQDGPEAVARRLQDAAVDIENLCDEAQYTYNDASATGNEPLLKLIRIINGNTPTLQDWQRLNDQTGRYEAGEDYKQPAEKPQPQNTPILNTLEKTVNQWVPGVSSMDVLEEMQDRRNTITDLIEGAQLNGITREQIEDNLYNAGVDIAETIMQIIKGEEEEFYDGLSALAEIIYRG